MQEFSVIDSAVTVEQLRMRLKEDEMEQFGDPVLSEYVYDVINRLPRFSSMRVSEEQSAMGVMQLKIFAARAPTGCRRIPWVLARRPS